MQNVKKMASYHHNKNFRFLVDQAIARNTPLSELSAAVRAGVRRYRLGVDLNRDGMMENYNYEHGVFVSSEERAEGDVLRRPDKKPVPPDTRTLSEKMKGIDYGGSLLSGVTPIDADTAIESFLNWLKAKGGTHVVTPVTPGLAIEVPENKSRFLGSRIEAIQTALENEPDSIRNLGKKLGIRPEEQSTIESYIPLIEAIETALKDSDITEDAPKDKSIPTPKAKPQYTRGTALRLTNQMAAQGGPWKEFWKEQQKLGFRPDSEDPSLEESAKKVWKWITKDRPKEDKKPDTQRSRRKSGGLVNKKKKQTRTTKTYANNTRKPKRA